MSNIVLHGSPTETEGIFFGLTPQVTDWDAFLAAVPKTSLEGLLAECHNLEPLQEDDSRDFSMWVLQQKIRYVLRYKKKQPILSNETCPTCGVHKLDEVLYQCVWCEEREVQIGRYGGRGSCQFIRPTYDPSSRSWGLLYYWSHHNDVYMFWLASGFKTRCSVELAVYPFKLYEDWLRRKYHSLYAEWSIEHRLFDLAGMMTCKALPFNPTEFDQQSRERIRLDMKEEHTLSSWDVDEALRDHDRDESGG
jgi:hypothetical protein